MKNTYSDLVKYGQKKRKKTHPFCDGATKKKKIVATQPIQV